MVTPGMEILINGEPTQIPEGTTAAQLLDRLELGGKRVALEVNSAIVPRSILRQHRFRPGDRVEIVHAIGGG
jgi:sulfur carrier protein